MNRQYINANVGLRTQDDPLNPMQAQTKFDNKKTKGK